MLPTSERQVWQWKLVSASQLKISMLDIPSWHLRKRLCLCCLLQKPEYAEVLLMKVEKGRSRDLRVSFLWCSVFPS